MDFFISAAQAQTGGEPASAWGSLIMLVVFFAIFYFLIIRPHQKRMNEHKKMVDALSRNDEVVTQGGMLGRIEEIDESFVTLEVAQGVKLRVQKQAVTGVMPKGTFRAH